MVMGGVRQSVLLEEAIRQICRTALWMNWRPRAMKGEKVLSRHC